MQRIELNIDTYDKHYGRMDLAPRVLGLEAFEGNTGYLLAYLPETAVFVIQWDGALGEVTDVRVEEFKVIAGVTF